MCDICTSGFPREGPSVHADDARIVARCHPKDQQSARSLKAALPDFAYTHMVGRISSALVVTRSRFLA